MPTQLYLLPEPRRYFLVPDGAALPAGPLVLRTPRGRRLSITEEAAAQLELPADEGAALERQIRAEMAEEGRALLARLGQWRQVAADLATVVNQAAEDRPSTPGAAPARLSAALGVSLEDFRANPGVTWDVTADLVMGLWALTGELLDDSEEGKARVREREAALGAALAPVGGADRLFEVIRVLRGQLSPEARERAVQARREAEAPAMAAAARWDQAADAWVGVSSALRGAAPGPLGEPGEAWRAALSRHAVGLLQDPAQGGPALQAALTPLATALAGLLLDDDEARGPAEARLEGLADELEGRRPDSAEALRGLVRLARQGKSRSP